MQTAYMATGKPKLEQNNLRAWREHRELTQAALGELAGTTGQVISNLENGERGLGDKWLRRLAPHLGVTPGTLLDHTPESYPDTLAEAWNTVPNEDRPKALRMLKSLGEAA